MEMMIRGLVYAEEEEAAVENARERIFDPLTLVGPFQSYNLYSGDDLPMAARSTTGLGHVLIESGWDSTVAEYRVSFSEIQDFLDNHEPVEYWMDEDIHREYSFNFRSLGEKQGKNTYLYDQDGQGIRTRDHLSQVLTHWDGNYDDLDSNPLMKKNLYVVPAEVRY